ncbi:MAG: hypothetical protein Q7T74_06560, partial [Candidatus Saccharibacteria bacterium]|nr:hypothetical protein [Candidatus Saccharibacteria bacterium]
MNSAGKLDKLLFKDHRHNSTKIFAIVIGSLVIFATIPLTVFLTQKSDEVSRNPQAAVTRDPLKQPFASDSPWNMPIGSN